MYRTYQRQPIRKPTQRDYEAKLLILILRRSINRYLTEQFKEIKNSTTHKHQTVSSIVRIAEHCSQTAKIKAWNKLRVNVFSFHKQERMLKDVLNLSRRFHSSIMSFAFQKIYRKSFASNTQTLNKVQESKKRIMFQTLKKLLYARKQIAMGKINVYSQFKKQRKRIVVIGMIMKSAQRRLLLNAWSKILLESGKTLSVVINKTETDDLTLQLQDLRVQVENKNMNISRLQEEIDDLKQVSYSQQHQPNSIYYPLSSSNLNRSGRSSRKKINNSSMEKDSNDGSFLKDLSFGSMFNGSLRSRGSTKKNICDCQFGIKYQKYKSAAQSYKNQLEIIKAELEFTKEMNEHMENQIKLQIGNDEKDHKIERLRGQLKEVQRDRDHLVEKVAKYEKYTAKLKSEFKMKIEEIYRKVKKGN